MAQQTINLGTVDNDGTGDSLKVGGDKINDNFTELYGQKDTDGTLAANSDAKVPSQKAVKTYVDTAVTGLLDFKGSTNASANPNYPAASKGDAYVVSAAGKIGGASGKSVDIGDVYVAIADNAGGTEASVGTSWVVLEHNLVGALLAANNLSDVASASAARANLGAQAQDADLDAIAALTTTAYGRALLTLANALAADWLVRAGDTLTGALNWAAAVDVASAGTTDIGAAASNIVRITGTTTITSLGTIAAGAMRFVRFAGALTLTHNATSLILPGNANIVTAAGDTAEFVSEGSGNWRCRSYQRAAVGPLSVATIADVQVFNANGTWTKPADAKTVDVFCFGAGGGGGGGAKAAAATAQSGGAAGGGGSFSRGTFNASDLAATVAVTAGTGGTAGTGATSNGNGGNGGTGGGSTFGTHVIVYGGGGGAGGQVGTGSGGGGGGGLYSDAANGSGATGGGAGQGGSAGGSGGAAIAATTAGGGGGGCDTTGATPGAGAVGGPWGGGGGGAGGGITSGNATATGAIGGRAVGNTTALSGGTSGNAGSTASALVSNLPGGGGGGGGSSTGSNGGAGGAGQTPSGGGGGGAGSQSGNGGAGGTGGAGRVVVITRF